MKKINKKTLIFILIALALFIVPFFWLKPGEMDLGGDSNRLYFYDPLSMLKEFAIYSVVPWGTGIVSYNQYFIPFLLFLISLKSLFSSPTIIIDIVNGLKLSGSFIFIFLILKELFRKEEGEIMTLPQFAGSVIGALFYTFSPAVLENMKYALVTHNQVFLNPMIFYYLLRYLKTLSLKYIWIALFVTLVFSTNFSLHAPPMFAFYPLSIFFLLLYNFLVLRKPFPFKGAIFFILFFFGLHAFHLIPVASNLLDKGSELNTRAFESFSKTNVGLEYFTAILPSGKVSTHILSLLEKPILSWTLIIIPALVILGFLSLKKRNRTLLLVSIFFFITLFLVSANITLVGAEFYKRLFYIPGFGIFRNFGGQWQWVYAFFYALLAGLSTFHLFSKIRRRYTYIILVITIGFLMGRSLIVFNGNIVNVFNRGSVNIPVVIRIDPNYEKMLFFIKNIPNDGKILHVPFTDFGYNLVGGSNGGVYVGQSMISLVVGKNDFSGYQDIDPFSESLRKLAKEKNYPLIKQMLSLLQVRYILYDSDGKVSDKFFPTFPYGYTGVPASSSAALDFVRNISNTKVYQSGHYSLFEVNKDEYLPHFYIPKSIFLYDTNPKYDVQYSKALSFFPPNLTTNNKDSRIAFMDRQACKKIFSKEQCSKDELSQNTKDVNIIFQRINPTKYKLEIKNVTKPFLLVFQNSYSSYWKLYQTNFLMDSKKVDTYYDGEVSELLPVNGLIDNKPFETKNLKSIYENSHIMINGYANAWYIDDKSNKYEIIVEETSQKIFYYSLVLSLVTFFVFIIFGLKLLKNKYE